MICDEALHIRLSACDFRLPSEGNLHHNFGGKDHDEREH
jgi:hypothetical protein